MLRLRMSLARQDYPLHGGAVLQANSGRCLPPSRALPKHMQALRPHDQPVAIQVRAYLRLPVGGVDNKEHVPESQGQFK